MMLNIFLLAIDSHSTCAIGQIILAIIGNTNVHVSIMWNACSQSIVVFVFCIYKV